MQVRTPSLPFGMSWLLERLMTIKYAQNNSGVCEGVACTAMMYGLANKLTTFDKILEMIYAIPPKEFAEFISIQNEKYNSITKKVKENIIDANPDLIQKRVEEELEKLPIDEQLSIAIPSVCKSLECFTFPDMHPELFPKGTYHHLQDPIIMAPLVLPHFLKQQGGLIKIGSFTGIYDWEELRDYVASLANAAKEIDPDGSVPIALLLRICNHNIKIGYDSETKEWVLVDGVVLPSLRYDDPNDLVNNLNILLTLSAKEHANASACFSTTLYGTKSTETILRAILAAWKNDKRWQKLHEVTEKKVKQQDPRHTYWLYVAAREGETEVVKNLLAKGADPNLGTEGAVSDISSKTRFDSVPPFYIALQNGYSNVARMLMDADGFNFDFKTCEGLTPLFQAAKFRHNEIVKALVTRNDPNIPTSDGATAIFIAAQYGYSDVVKTLLDNHANPALTIDNGSTTLHIAAQEDHPQVIELLLKHIDVNFPRQTDGVSPLYLASQTGAIKSMEYLLANGADPNQSRHDGATPLDVAIQSENSTAAIEILLAHGAKPNTVNRDLFEQPLIRAILKGNIAIAKRLLANGADPNALHSNRVTATYLATQFGYVELVKELILRGADLNRAPANGATPLFIAVFHENLEVVKILVTQVDITLEATLDIDYLRDFAKKRNVEASMEKFIKHKSFNKSVSELSISPLELAEVLGNAKIINLLRPVSTAQLGLFSESSPKNFKINYTNAAQGPCV